MQQQPPSQGAGGTGEALRSDAKQLGNSAAKRIYSEVDARKDEAADQAKSVSSAMQKTAGELDNAPNWLKSAIEQGAQQVQRFADTIEQKDSRQLVGEARTFARERPGTFLAACAAAGFAAARIFKAGSEQEAGPSGQSGPSPSMDRQNRSTSDRSRSSSSEQGMRSNAPGEYA